MYLTQLLIDGALVAGAGREEAILNPATGEVICTVAEASVEQVAAAVAAALRRSVQKPAGWPLRQARWPSEKEDALCA